MSPRCIDVPISWLRLERHHLGESDEAERAQITSHVAACEACAAALASIEADDAVALPPLPVARIERRSGATRVRRVAVVLTSGLALAAAVAMSVNGGWKHGGTGGSSGATRTKGDAVAFSLVRDDDERIDEAAGVFRDGDRFKALVSCPPSMDATFDVVVYDESGASFPLAPSHVACGNGVPLPGAFRLSGSSAEKVCLVWAIGADVDRRELTAGPPTERSLCKSLTSSPR